MIKGAKNEKGTSIFEVPFLVLESIKCGKALESARSARKKC